MDRFKRLILVFSAFAMGIGFSLSGALPSQADFCRDSGAPCTTCSCCKVDGELTYDGGDWSEEHCEHLCIPPGGCDPPY